jgi:DNA-binding IclR family transcriptional regulator
MTLRSSERWDRLRDVLLAIKPGDSIAVDVLVTQTGLPPETARTVLESLARAELFQPGGDDVFIRLSALDVPKP